MNKSGFVDGMMKVIVWAAIFSFFILMVYAGGMILPILVPTAQEVLTTAGDAMQSTGDANIQAAADVAITPINQSLNNAEWMAYTMLILMFLSYIVMCFYVRTYPFLLWIWIIMIVILCICSIWMTVAYQDMSADSELGAYYHDWGNVDFALRNLPAIVFILGVIGGIIMFMLSNRDSAAEMGGGPL